MPNLIINKTCQLNFMPNVFHLHISQTILFWKQCERNANAHAFLCTLTDCSRCNPDKGRGNYQVPDRSYWI